MRLHFAVALVALTQPVSAFAPQQSSPSLSTSTTRWTNSLLFSSTSSTQVEDSVAESVASSLENQQRNEIVPFTESEINARFSRQMEKLQLKDATSTLLSKEVSE